MWFLQFSPVELGSFLMQLFCETGISKERDKTGLYCFFVFWVESVEKQSANSQQCLGFLG